MHMDLFAMAQGLTIVSLSCGIIKLFIVNPLQDAINALNEQLGSLQDVLDKVKSEQHSIDKRLVKVEESLKSAHKRIDSLERGDFNA